MINMATAMQRKKLRLQVEQLAHKYPALFSKFVSTETSKQQRVNMIKYWNKLNPTGDGPVKLYMTQLSSRI